MQAIPSLAVTVLTHVLDLLAGGEEKYKNWKEKKRQTLTFHGLHHKRTDTERLHIHRKKGGRLMQKDRGYVTEINKFMEYLEGRKGPLMQTIKIHQ